MANERLLQIDFCRGLRVARRFDPRDPLDAVIPVGLAPAACRPVLVHHRTDDGAILSRIDQATGTPTATLLTAADEGTSNPDVTPTLATLRRNVLTGSAVLPYPASGIAWEVIFTTNGQPHLRTISGLTPTDVGQIINADGRSASVLGTSIWRDIVLGGPAPYVDTIFRPFKSYDYGMVYQLCPNNEPSILRYTGTEYVWPNVALGAGRSTNTGTKNVRLLIWEAEPAFASLAGATLEPSAIPLQQANGPSLARKFCFHELNSTAMPAYGGTFGPTTHATAGARSNFILWCNDDMEAVEVNGSTGASFASTAPFSRIDGFLPSAFNSYTFTKAFQYSTIDVFDVTFAIKFTAFGGMVFDTTGSPFTFSLQSDIPRWYEGVAVAYDTAP